MDELSRLINRAELARLIADLLQKSKVKIVLKTGEYDEAEIIGTNINEFTGKITIEVMTK